MSRCAIFLLAAAFLVASASKVDRRVNDEEFSGTRSESPDGDEATADDFVDQGAADEGDYDSATFFLYTQRNPELGEELMNLDDLKLSRAYSWKNPNVFIVHGWKNNYQSPVNTLIKSALLDSKDVNVFVVDWSFMAKRMYVVARYAVPDVGVQMAKFINDMMEHYRLSPLSFTMIGHSLGAHVCGIAGENVRGTVSIIVGLDPAMPLFSLKDPSACLDRSDANFVQIVHTNGGRLGLQSAIGHSDYYPNGGDWQPGCGFDLKGTCSHSRAYQYFAESLQGKGFASFLCSDFESFNAQICFKNHLSHIGGLDIDTRAFGDYYLNTTSTEPFSIF